MATFTVSGDVNVVTAVVDSVNTSGITGGFTYGQSNIPSETTASGTVITDAMNNGLVLIDRDTTYSISLDAGLPVGACISFVSTTGMSSGGTVTMTLPSASVIYRNVWNNTGGIGTGELSVTRGSQTGVVSLGFTNQFGLYDYVTLRKLTSTSYWIQGNVISSIGIAYNT